MDGAEVEWKPLSLVTEMQRGKTITAKSANEGKIPVISGGKNLLIIIANQTVTVRLLRLLVVELMLAI